MRSYRTETPSLPRSATIPPFLAAWLVLAGCNPADGPDASAATPATWLPPAGEARACFEGGRFRATLHGALQGEIDWRAVDMSCEGMPRPGGAGARLRFAGRAGPDDVPLAVIIAIPGLERGVTGTDLASNITIIEEGRGRFFSTTNPDYCWVDIDREAPVPAHETLSLLDGTMNCIAPLAETNGDTSVTIENLRFSGFVDWDNG